MVRTPVSSSDLASVGYDPTTRVMEIEFVRGAVYEYANIPPAVHAGLMAADSHGKYFNVHVKHSYAYRRLQAPRR
jgi:hypothetical protein